MSKVSVDIDNSSGMIPEWITADYVQKVLSSYRNDDSVKLKKLKLEYATKKGEGYASVMVRVIVDYELTSTGSCESGTYLIKFPFDQNSYAAKYFLEFDVYNQEISMYSKYLPEIKKVLQEAHVDDHFYPETLYVDREHSAIVLEDLKVKSFKLVDCLKGLDLRQTKIVLDKLARMHAASAKLDNITPGIYKSCDHGLHNRYTKALDTFYMDGLENCIRLASGWKNFGKYVEKLKKLRPHFMEKCRQCYDPKPGFFNVLAHGDLWTNNIMFQFDENDHPSDVMIFDYQFSIYTSPAIDLMFFLNTSCQDELRFSKRKELTEYYYQQLVDNLKKLNYKGKVLTLEEFWDQYDHDSFYCFVTGCIDRALCCIDDSTDADFRMVMGNEEVSYKFRKSMYDTPKMQANLKVLLPYFDLHGILDIK